MLKFITCGSVDDGKSTLIGHMLYDAKLLFADQKRALELDSKVGSADGEMDYSLLLDGLMAEREQGIKHFVFAVNKMDLVNYSQERFCDIKKNIKLLMAEFEYESVKIIPVSATAGDNVTKPSQRMGWYHGSPLLEYLENVDVSDDNGNHNFSMPVQRVCRPNRTFRGF